jgi:hypothetical protein
MLMHLQRGFFSQQTRYVLIHTSTAAHKLRAAETPPERLE